MRNICRLLILIFFFTPVCLQAQQFFRIRADVSVKTKLSSGDQSLTMGKIYYDRNEKKIIYDLTFPEKNILVTADTITYRIVDNQIIQRSFSPSIVEFSVFHLALSSHLPEFGLKRTQYEISKVAKEGQMVITTWTPPDKLAEDLGNILISVVDRKLYAVVFLSPDGSVKSKQFFEDYIERDGLAFPGKIVEISYSPEGENYQIMSFKNLVVDELENNHMYSFSVDGLR
ncbi:MAG: hypothetical protein HN352_15345 [Bacteroidetes bacterium]|nr:hypothetical protein [Bacteroidota bacterium]MBT3749731.1 hypothetical protein [Bacteroidota bacterium]MBT4401976.1 hypothetical protein [Bacteroidota bacterium]MBT4412236.1 hypothetical protein [Bacteroidota bacterium]MBT5427246.1 hypothetical protein [Bacteroidota bacterium]